MPHERRGRMFDRHVRIPDTHMVTDEWNKRLTSPTTEGEVLRAIRSMSRHKVAGLDQVPNDFFIDCSESVAPRLAP